MEQQYLKQGHIIYDKAWHWGIFKYIYDNASI